MPRWEDKFVIWSQGPSQSEQDRLDRTAREVNLALRNYPRLQARSLEIFAQGSFANRVNVRKESDVDICSLCDESFLHDEPVGRSLSDFVSTAPATYLYRDYKNDVEAALVARFGRPNVIRGNKAIDVHHRPIDIDADVVAMFEYRDYRIPSGGRNHTVGTAMFSDRGDFLTNFPKQQYDNGVLKHQQTNRRFKRQVRIQKNLRNEMEEKGIAAATPIKSFLLESLCWNVPNQYYGKQTYFADFEVAMTWLYQITVSDLEANGLWEVNGVKRLFGGHNSWTRHQVRSYIEAAWAYTHYA